MGTIAYCNSSQALSTVEVGFIIILPPYQRTHVSSHAIGLMMKYALDMPKDGGLGVRRVQWQAHGNNAPSIKAGKRMGFKLEGIIR
jgi:RimJ/RimL family protein N-acetyltransferase